jgi:hypothetical protein
MDELNAKLKAPVPGGSVSPRPLPLKKSEPGLRKNSYYFLKNNLRIAKPVGPASLKRAIVSDPNFKTTLPSQSLDSVIKAAPGNTPDNGLLKVIPIFFSSNMLQPSRSTDRPGNRLSAGNLPTAINIPPPVAPMISLPPAMNLPPPVKLDDMKKSTSMEEGLSTLLAKPSLEDKLKSLEDLQARNAELVRRLQKHVVVS